MSFNFGIIFAVVCLIGGLLMIIFCKPFWWLMKKSEMPGHFGTFVFIALLIGAEVYRMPHILRLG